MRKKYTIIYKTYSSFAGLPADIKHKFIECEYDEIETLVDSDDEEYSDINFISHVFDGWDNLICWTEYT